MLAWWLIAPERFLHADGFTRDLFNSLLRVGVARAQSPRRLKAAIFPLREGELIEFKEVFRQLTLEEAASPKHVACWAKKAWLFLCMCSLNALAGTAAAPVCGRWSQAERRAAESIGSAIGRRLAHDVELDMVTETEWQKDLQSRQIGYNGEEVAKCYELTWEQVLPSLPPEEHGGSIDALSWVSERTREFLLNPQLLLKRKSSVVLPKLPGKVHVRSSDKMRIALELVRRNICDWFPLSQVYEVQGVKVLNGLFGVSKPSKLESGEPVLRLIMNLTGSNATQEQLEGGCLTLPGITSWQSVVMDNNERLELFQSDMSSAFYLFRIPKIWRGHLAFNIVASGEDIGLTKGIQFALSCAVIPMGWLNSVGIMQEISENLMRWGGVNCQNQIFKGRPLPIWLNDILRSASDKDRAWFHVYLDNFCAGERLLPELASTRGSLCHEQAEQAWAMAGVVSSAKKRISASRRVTELGAEVDGELQTLGVSGEKVFKLVQSSLWLLVQRHINRKHLQILMGRWIFVLQFRRPAMAILEKVWKLISGTEKISAKLRLEVRREVLQLIFMTPLLHCNLAAAVEERMVATDASEKGCAVVSSHELSSEGLDYLQASRRVEAPGASEQSPILVVSLFNGIGGAFRSYDAVGVLPMGRIAVECNAGANRITLRRWPGTLIVEDVKLVDRIMVGSWSRKFLRVQEVHLWAGFPCTDLSSAKFGRENLSGTNSSLFWEIPRIKKLIKEEFGESVVVKSAVENVASMDESACREISEALEAVPYKLDSVDAVPMRRPRYAWVSEPLEGTFPDLEIIPKRYWREVTAAAVYPRVDQWLEPHHIWEGESMGAVFPTCMKSIPRRVPPPRPAGLQRCTDLAIKRWTEDEYRYPPYQYESQFVISTPTTWRLLSAEEKELLLGYGFSHTAVAWSASQIKNSRQGFDDARHSYLGDSFSVYSFCIVAGALCQRFTMNMSYKHVAGRLGMAPGFRAHIRSQIPLGRFLAYGSESVSLPRTLGMEQFNRSLLRKTNHTGSDVRVVTGEFTNPKIFPRQAVSARWWTWKDEFSRQWKNKSHINVLELEAILLGIKHQVCRYKSVDKRIFQLSDSYICISVVSKGRSGSLQLNRVLRRVAAWLLGFGLHLIIAHVESTENPSDKGSRQW